jgi:cobalt-zinc-cadmium efflux system outer membrane protein
MRRLLIPTLIVLAGCHACVDVPSEIEVRLRPTATAHSTADAPPLGDARSLPAGPIDLSALWALTQANNPSLREAAAGVEAARGRLIQAGKYPNPKFNYSQEELGTPQDAAGSLVVQVNQEIVTGGKRRLDRAIAARGTDAAALDLLARKFEVLSRVRRAYYDFAGLASALRVQEEALAGLRRAVEITRKQVEEIKTRPRTDLLRVQALLKEAEVNRDRDRIALEAAWGQLAADAGLPPMPVPPAKDLPTAPPEWDRPAVEARVLAASVELGRADLEAERARLEVERARAEAIPNVTLGGGFSRNFAENERGGVVSVETALPLWDRKEGRLYEAQAHLAGAQAAQQATAVRLRRQTAEAFGRYQAARRQVEQLAAEVLPPLLESLDLLQKGYQAGAAQFSFADVLSAEQAVLSTRLTLAEARRNLWLAIADLEGLMQLDLGEGLHEPEPH